MAEGIGRCDGRYPVPQTSPPRDEPFDVTYRCALPLGHLGPHGNGEVSWQSAALRLGEELSSVGPDGYYEMTPEQWRTWALKAVARRKAEGIDLSGLARETADTLTRHMRGELVPEVRELFAKVIKAALVRVQQEMIGGEVTLLKRLRADNERLRGELEQAQQSLAAAEASEQSTREASMRWQMRAEQAERDLAQARQSLAGAASACATVVKVEVEACRVRVRRETLEDVKAGIEAAADRRPALMNPDTMRHIAAQIAIWADHQIDLRRLRDSSGEG